MPPRRCVQAPAPCGCGRRLAAQSMREDESGWNCEERCPFRFALSWWSFRKCTERTRQERRQEVLAPSPLIECYFESSAKSKERRSESQRLKGVREDRDKDPGRLHEESCVQAVSGGQNKPEVLERPRARGEPSHFPSNR